MLRKKYLIITVGIATVLLVSLFVNNSIRAQTDEREYDPWLDYNEDGTVDVNDLYSLGQAYGASGDPTKHVNVTNWPLDADGNLKVGIDRPVDKYGNLKTYVTNFPKDASGNLKVNVTDVPSNQNVTVTNLPMDENGNLMMVLNHRYVQWSHQVSLGPYGNTSFQEDTAGYKDIHLALSAEFCSVAVQVEAQAASDSFICLDEFGVSMGNSTVRTYPALGTVMRIRVSTGCPVGAAFNIAFYMIT